MPDLTPWALTRLVSKSVLWSKAMRLIPIESPDRHRNGIGNTHIWEVHVIAVNSGPKSRQNHPFVIIHNEEGYTAGDSCFRTPREVSIQEKPTGDCVYVLTIREFEG